MRLALLLVMLCAACASSRPQHRDSPQYRACKLVCADEGATGAAMLEDEDSVVCLCNRSPETT